MDTRTSESTSFSTHLRDPELDDVRPRGPLGIWYYLTAPPEPEPTADYQARDLHRRGLLGSRIMGILQIILFIIIPIGLLGPNKQIFFTAIFLTVIVIICAAFNRSRKVNVAGVILSVALNLGICLSIIRSPGGLTPDSIAMFDILVFSELFVVSLLPPYWVWASWAFNVAFSCYELTYAPRTPLFQQVMKTSYYAVLSRPIQIHTIVTVVAFLWVIGANRAIKRADRAEEIARLEHHISQQNKEAKERKLQLENGVQQVVETLKRWSNGDVAARIVLSQENVLREAAGAINHLLGWIQRLHQESIMLQRLMEAMTRFYEARTNAKGGKIDWQITNTPVDALVRQHNSQVQQSNNDHSMWNFPDQTAFPLQDQNKR